MQATIRRIRTAFAATALALSLSLSLATGLTGCEERVVGTRNDWVGSQLNRVKPEPPPPDPADEFFDDAGETLFGWTRHLTGEKKKAEPRPIYGEVDMSSRRAQPSRSSGSGE